MKQERYTIRLTLDEINALLAAAGNADAGAMSEDFETEKEGQDFLNALERAMKKLQGE